MSQERGDAEGRSQDDPPSGTTEAALTFTAAPEADLEEVDRLTRGLWAEVKQLELDLTPFAAPGDTPDGAKAVDAVTLGAVVVALSASGGVFTSLIETLRDWLGRQSSRHRISVTVGEDTLKLERATTAEREKLIEAFVRRHSGDQS